MVAVIHQPHFLPWIGYFNKISNSDVFIVQDNVQFRKNYYQNRTLIRNNREEVIWLTLPVHSELKLKIFETKIVSPNWKEKVIKTLYHSYHKKPFFIRYFDRLEASINGCTDNLLETNLTLLRLIIEILQIEVEIRLASEFRKMNSASEDLVNICNSVGASSYLFGEGGGISYHGLNIFKVNSIDVYQQRFLDNFSNFSRRYYPLCHNLSIVDYLFNLPIKDLRKVVHQTWRITKH